MFTKYNLKGYGLNNDGTVSTLNFEYEINMDEFRVFCLHYQISTSDDVNILRYLEWKFSVYKMKKEIMHETLKECKGIQLINVELV